MTGYGSGEATAPNGRVTIEARAVNHRFLDVRSRAAPELAGYVRFAEEHVRNRLERGRIELVLRFDAGPAKAPVLDRERARRAYGDLCAVRDEIAPGEPVPLSLLSVVPDLFVPAGTRDGDALREAVVAATTSACDELEQMRVREGAALARDIGDRLAILSEHASAIAALQPAAVEAYRARLRERVARLVEGSAATLDPGRIEQEVALLADRTDVTEEITRLQSHAEQLLELLSAGGAVGRRTDFLLQEMNREVNTIGSKGADAEIGRAVVELKAELERMREQAQNVL
jgi:uncharacterized protein (TIGR00255 family)